ncbi:MAG: GFA family protein [Parvularculaceae bacterium]
MSRTAGCACGLSVSVVGEPVRVSVCHCTDCKRRTGSAFGAQARFADAGVTISGDARCFERTADSGAKYFPSARRLLRALGDPAWTNFPEMPGRQGCPDSLLCRAFLPKPRTLFGIAL